ncbi:MAG: Rab family GTPase [Candidatus Heimdallarchaeaceae archaeon]
METFKLALIGDSAVGKTEIIRSFSGDTRKDKEFGHNIASRDLELSDGRTVSVVLWDLPGQKRFEAVRRTFYQGSDAILIVFDMTRRTTFTSLHKWVKEVAESLQYIPKIALIGTKKDLTEYQEIDREEIAQIASNPKFNFPFYLINATNPTEVEKIIEMLLFVIERDG